MKKILKAIWDEFIYGGHLLSLGALSIVLSASSILGGQISYDFLIVIYAGIHLFYTFNRYIEADIDAGSNPGRSLHYIGKKKFFLYEMIILSALLLGIVLFKANIYSLILVLVLGILGISYTLLFKGLSRYIMGLKDIFIPLPYALMILLYLYYYQYPFSLGALLFMFFVYLRLFIAVCFYDIKDARHDKELGLRTFANSLNPKTFSLFLTFFNLISILMIAIGIMLNVLPGFSLILLILFAYFLYYLLKARKSTDILMISYILCDGEYILWFPLILISRLLWHS